MDIEAEDLIGTWQKQTEAKCAAKYPVDVRFGTGGLYRAPEGIQTGSIWHGGDWEFLANDRLRVQASNDAMREYEVIEFGNGKFVLQDEAGCQVVYVNSMSN